MKYIADKINRSLIPIFITLLTAAATSSCLLFKDDPLFSCGGEGDCSDGMKCVISSYESSGICRYDDWCEGDSHCDVGETCVEGSCTVLGGEGGQCRDDGDCGTLSCIDLVCVEVGGTDGYCVTKNECSDGYECLGEKCTCVASEEVCDGIDNDCDGRVDEDLSGISTKSCGTGECERVVDVNCKNGLDDSACVPGSPEAEECDGVDNDCDGETDENLGTVTCGEGACEVTMDRCAKGAEQTCVPGAPSVDICDGIDNDCDGFVDNDPDIRLEIQTDVVLDRCLGITWQRGSSDVMGERESGQKYCGDLVLDNNADWRLATGSEYRDILNGTGCAESSLCDPMFPGDTRSYWGFPTDSADFATGILTNTPIGHTNGGYFRCVRNTDPFSVIEETCAGSQTGEWIFIENGIVDDACFGSGLMWQQEVTAVEYTNSQAVAYCNTLELGGYSDWRLPSSDEFMAVLDSCQQFSSGTFYCTPCPHAEKCNLMFQGDISWHWSIDGLPVEFLSGEVHTGYEDYNDFPVRCVRTK